MQYLDRFMLNGHAMLPEILEVGDLALRLADEAQRRHLVRRQREHRVQSLAVLVTEYVSNTVG